MKTQAPAEKNHFFARSATPITNGVLQRKCACGSHMGAGGECKGCAAKKGVLQRKLTIGASNDPLEQEADRVTNQVMSTPLNSAINRTPPKIQRFTSQASDGLNTGVASENGKNRTLS